MTISPISAAAPLSAPNGLSGVTTKNDPKKTREAFDTFVGETFYGQMLKALRSTVDKPAYFHGGRAEEVFQAQFDQVVAQELAKKNAASFTGPLYKQFMAQLDVRG